MDGEIQDLEEKKRFRLFNYYLINLKSKLLGKPDDQNMNTNI